jgi:hypothetical protein
MLRHLDRIIFGSNPVFLFLKKFNPKEIMDMDFEKAHLERQKEIDEEEREKNEESEKKKEEQLLLLKKSLEDKYVNEKNEIEKEMINKMEDYEAKFAEMKKNEEQIKLNNQESIEQMNSKILLERILIEKKKKKNNNENRDKNDLVRPTNDLDKGNDQGEHKSKKLEHSLHNIVKKINKLKLIIDEVGRNLHLEVFLSKNILDHIDNKNSSTSILVRVSIICVFF